MSKSTIDEQVRVGFNARLFPSNWRPVLNEIQFARDCGFQALQIRAKPEGLEEAQLGASFETVARALREADLTLAIEIAVYVDETGRTESGGTLLDTFRANLPALVALESRHVHWHVATCESLTKESVAALEERLALQFASAVTWAQDRGFQFAFEHNDPDLRLFYTPARCQWLLDQTPGLGFVWDFCHTSQEHIAGFKALAPWTTLLHVSDTALPEVNEHLPLGLGSVDFEDYCRALAVGGFAGMAILEIGGLPKSGGFGRDTDAALSASRQRLAQAFAAIYS
ncbi:MAG: TIM barrel protein [Anaerolineae bacterium]|nr:TIM barrel protein [Anaerolineae bacterium]